MKVGLGEGMMEGADEGFIVVGNLVGLGVGSVEGNGLGEGLGICEGEELGNGVVGNFVGVGDGIIEGL